MNAHTDMQVEFALHEFPCSPEVITRALGITPTAVWSQGDAIPPSSVRRKSNGWLLRSEASPRVVDLEPHVKWLLSKLPSSLDVLKEGCATWYAEISVIVNLRDGAPVLHLPSELLGQVAALGASLDVDVYVRRQKH